jgi:aspartyl-tRNA(Asn)/glutamyl-tRNA(Gln) amidotransferase subunit C
MAITPEDVTRVARLARIALTDQDKARMQTELNGILELIQALQAENTQDIEPMAHPLSAHQDVVLRLREDQASAARNAEQRDELMANAPARHEGLFLVPKVIE